MGKFIAMRDHECPSCGLEFEKLTEYEDRSPPCPECHAPSMRLLTCTGAKNQDADWIKSVREVVDKDGGPHCQQFLKDPTRDNYETWQKVQGVRHLEPGEEKINRAQRAKDEQTEHKRKTRIAVENLKKKRAITVRV